MRRVLLAAIALSLLVLPFIDSSKAAGEEAEAELGADADVEDGAASEASTGMDEFSEAVSLDGGELVGIG